MKLEFTTSPGRVKGKMRLTGWVQQYAKELDRKLQEAEIRADDDPNAMEFKLPIHQAKIPEGVDGEKVVEMLNKLFADASVDGNDDEDFGVVVVLDLKNGEADAYDKDEYQKLIREQSGSQKNT